ncbi:unnamed protein product [Rhizophagus irregularis]|nr:unnamed protein product [Rhizophagus irregularis]
MKAVEMDDYLQITLPKLWKLDDFVSWCGSCEKFKGDKVKILDHMKKRLEKTADNNLIKEDIRQKAKDLKMKFKSWKSSQTTTKFFEQLEIRYNAKRKLEEIESQKAIELAEIERMKVSQLRNNTESVTKIHQHVSDGFVEFTKENTRVQKRTLEDSESSSKDKSATDRGHYALRDRQEIDYNEERMAKKQFQSEDRDETPKRIKHNNLKNYIEVCSPSEICRKCWSKINNFELGDYDLSDDEYEERLIEANIANSAPFPTNINTTGLKIWTKKIYAYNIYDTLSNLRETTKIDGFDSDQFDLIKRVLEYKLMHLIAGHGNQLDVSLMDENTYTSTVISQDFELLKLCFPGLFVSQWNENDVPSSKWRRELVYGTGALARKADAYVVYKHEGELFRVNLGAPQTFAVESMLKVDYSFKYTSFTKITDIINLFLLSSLCSNLTRRFFTNIAYRVWKRTKILYQFTIGLP